MLGAGRMFAGHVSVVDAGLEYLNDSERSIFEGIENDEQREAYIRSRFKVKSLLRRKVESKVRCFFQSLR